MPSPKQSAGIQSVEIGVDVLHALAQIGGPASLGAISKQCQMQPNKVHRYLVSFVRTGLVAQQRGSGEYELGPALRVLGLTALRLMDPYQRLFDRLRMLREELQCSAILSVWSDAGATVIGWENGVHHTAITFRLGSTLPLVRSSAGRVFLSHLPGSITKGVLKAERALEGRSAVTKSLSDAELAEIRKAGFAFASEEILPGVDALSAPVFDNCDALFAVLTVLAPRRYIEGRALDRARATLLRTTEAASKELGCQNSRKSLP